MKVKELITELQRLDPEAVVIANTQNYNDDLYEYGYNYLVMEVLRVEEEVLQKDKQNAYWRFPIARMGETIPVKTLHMIAGQERKPKAVFAFNNAGIRSMCGVCREEFKPSISAIPFLSQEGVPDYGLPVCWDCYEANKVVVEDLFEDLWAEEDEVADYLGMERWTPQR